MVYNTALAGRAQINYAVTLHHYAASMIILVLEYVLILFFLRRGSAAVRTRYNRKVLTSMHPAGYGDIVVQTLIISYFR